MYCARLRLNSATGQRLLPTLLPGVVGCTGCIGGPRAHGPGGQAGRTRATRTPFPLGRQRYPEGSARSTPPALLSLLPHDGTRRGHCGLGPRPPAKCATHPSQLRAAQRAGPAARGSRGWCSRTVASLNSHDQYFFHRREDMVAGSVRPPRLDLANEALLRAHVHAVWLAQVRLPLGQSIEQVIDTELDNLPLKPRPPGQFSLPKRRKTKCANAPAASFSLTARLSPTRVGSARRGCKPSSPKRR